LNVIFFNFAGKFRRDPLVQLDVHNLKSKFRPSVVIFFWPEAFGAESDLLWSGTEPLLGDNIGSRFGGAPRASDCISNLTIRRWVSRAVFCAAPARGPNLPKKNDPSAVNHLECQTCSFLLPRMSLAVTRLYHESLNIFTKIIFPCPRADFPL
jgi:hypothetical protein